MNELPHTVMPPGTSWHANRPTIGFVNSHINSEWALWPWQGILDAAVAHQINLVSLIGNLIDHRYDFADQANVLYALADARRLDGLIIWKAGLVTFLSELESEKFCRRFDLPVVTIEGELPGAPCVTYGNYEGMHRLMTHLIEVHGYERIGFAGMLQHHAGFQERYQAYADAMRAYGLPENPEWTQPWFPNNAHEELEGGGDSIFHAYLRRAVAAGVEVLVGVADFTASKLLEGLRTLHVRVPHEVAVVGFDGFPGGRALTPPLTTIDPGWYQLGYQAMTTMVQMLAGESVPPRVTVPAQMLIRQSCGCVEASVTQAARRNAGAPASANTTWTPVESERLIQEIQRVLKDKGLEQLAEGAGAPLLNAVQQDVTKDASGTFLLELETLLRASLEIGKDILAWQDVLSILRQRITPTLTDPDAFDRADDLWHQARILIGNSAIQAELIRQQRADQQTNHLREIEQALMTTFDVAGIMDVLASRLPEIGIPRCYVATFEQPQTYHYPAPAPAWARLWLAYDEYGRRALPSEGLRFPSWQLMPPDILPSGCSSISSRKPCISKTIRLGSCCLNPGRVMGASMKPCAGRSVAPCKALCWCSGSMSARPKSPGKNTFWIALWRMCRIPSTLRIARVGLRMSTPHFFKNSE